MSIFRKSPDFWSKALLALLLLLAPAATPLHAQIRGGPADLGTGPDSAEETPKSLREVGFDQNLDAPLPLDLVFQDETGRAVTLGDYFGEGKTPVILSLVYYECPMLCPMTLQGLASSLKALEWSAGEDFQVVLVSIDPGEGLEAAAKAEVLAVSRYGRAGTEDGWHFLTGSEAAIERLAEAVGFRYVYDEERDEYAHAAGLVMATPSGHISRYFFGIETPAKDLKLGLMETADGRIGSLADQLLLYCFHYDAEVGRYAWSERALMALRIGAGLTILLLGGFIFLSLRRERKHRRAQPRTA